MQGSEYARLQFVEWLCDYGESIGRTVGAILTRYVGLTVLYGLAGSVVREGCSSAVVDKAFERVNAF